MLLKNLLVNAEYGKKKTPQYLPKKTVCVIHPLVYELCSDGLRIVWKSDVLQGVQK